MRQVERSAIVPFTAEAMFDLVADIESYPRFLPGCCGSSIHERSADQVVASIALAQGPLKTEFRTRNQMRRPERITMSLLDGPFSELQGSWEFARLGTTQGCRVSLDIRFAFASRVADFVLGPPFEAICNQLVDAFVKRARLVHQGSVPPG
jgi:ribosome-associated toxin RatA of RatAB toxin-antitoxin module